MTSRLSLRSRPGAFKATIAALYFAFATTGCSAAAEVGANETLVEMSGIVMRGPIQPVCAVGNSCDAPFSAGFTAYRSDRRVATFRSSADGKFTALVPAGTIVIVPDTDAPIIGASTQRMSVAVPASGVRDVSLHFDTGIR